MDRIKLRPNSELSEQSRDTSLSNKVAVSRFSSTFILLHFSISFLISILQYHIDSFAAAAATSSFVLDAPQCTPFCCYFYCLAFDTKYRVYVLTKSVHR